MRLIETKTEKKRAIEILTDAYYDAANVTWMLRRKTKKKLQALFLLLFHEAQAKNGAYISQNDSCILFLYDQKNKNQSIIQVIRKVYVFLFITGVSNGIRVLKFQKMIANIRPKEGMLGMALAAEKKQLTAATIFEVKRTVFDLARRKKQVVYVETTVVHLLKLYQSLGFIVYHQIKHPYAELSVWFLKREMP